MRNNRKHLKEGNSIDLPGYEKAGCRAGGGCTPVDPLVE